MAQVVSEVTSYRCVTWLHSKVTGSHSESKAFEFWYIYLQSYIVDLVTVPVTITKVNVWIRHVSFDDDDNKQKSHLALLTSAFLSCSTCLPIKTRVLTKTHNKISNQSHSALFLEFYSISIMYRNMSRSWHKYKLLRNKHLSVTPSQFKLPSHGENFFHKFRHGLDWAVFSTV